MEMLKEDEKKLAAILLSFVFQKLIYSLFFPHSQIAITTLAVEDQVAIKG